MIYISLTLNLRGTLKSVTNFLSQTIRDQSEVNKVRDGVKMVIEWVEIFTNKFRCSI